MKNSQVTDRPMTRENILSFQEERLVKEYCRMRTCGKSALNCFVAGRAESKLDYSKDQEQESLMKYKLNSSVSDSFVPLV